MKTKQFTAADTALSVIRQEGLDENETVQILDEFQGFLQAARSYEKEVMEIVVTDESQTVLIAKARERRLEIKKIRLDAEKTRVRLKEKSLREGRAIDGIGNIVKAIIVPMEEHLFAQENFVERLAEEKKERVHQERIAALTPFVEDVTLFNLKDMTPEGFKQLLESSESARKAEKDAERKAEEEKVAQAKLQKEENERVIAENARLKAEAEEQDKKAQEVLLAEKAKRDAETAKREIAEKELAEEKAKQDEVLRKEKEEREAKDEKERQESIAPDVEKLQAYAVAITSVKIPDKMSGEAMVILNNARQMIHEAHSYILNEIENL